MLLTITTTHQPATDLGYLLHKHPDRAQSFDLGFGAVHIVYPEASPERCTAAIICDIDPVRLTRGDRGLAGIEPYINDRPYTAGSFLSVAISRCFGTALAGRCESRPELANTPIPLEVTLAPVRGMGALATRLFEPLGYQVSVTPLDVEYGERSGYHLLTLNGTIRLAELLDHLYVLVPVLDGRKHYYTSDDEADKLRRRAETWLGNHPDRDAIVSRYLPHQRQLGRSVLDELATHDTADAAADEPVDIASLEEAALRAPSLAAQRGTTITNILVEAGAKRIVDLGCGEGRFAERLLDAGMDVTLVDASPVALTRAQRRLERRKSTLGTWTLLHGSATFADRRLAGYDAIVLSEVIEHVDVERHTALEDALFSVAGAPLIIVSTPNREYNVLYEDMGTTLRHNDHRFEWDRTQFDAWARDVADRYNYQVTVSGIGDTHPEHGQPSQIAIFTKTSPTDAVAESTPAEGDAA